MRKNLFVFFALVVMVAAVPMFGEVKFWPTDGSGFVGKGDVQVAFTWNNKTLQTRAADVYFIYKVSAVYEQVCGKDTGGTTIRQTRDRSVAVNAEVAHDARQKNQITGFNLNGFDSDSDSGNSSSVTIACPGGFYAIGSPYLVVGEGDGGSLWASDGNREEKLDWEPLE